MAKKLSSDSSLFAVTIALLGGGLVMVWSASSGLAQERYGNAYHFLIRQVVWACVGLVGMVAAMRMDYRKLRHPAVVYSAVMGTMLLLIAALFLPAVNDTHRWIRMGSLSLQPAEVAKLADQRLYYSSNSPAFVRSHAALLSLIQALAYGIYAVDESAYADRIKAFRLK